jgi:hypothetical protein
VCVCVGGGGTGRSAASPQSRRLSNTLATPQNLSLSVSPSRISVAVPSMRCRMEDHRPRLGGGGAAGSRPVCGVRARGAPPPPPAPAPADRRRTRIEGGGRVLNGVGTAERNAATGQALTWGTWGGCAAAGWAAGWAAGSVRAPCRREDIDGSKACVSHALSPRHHRPGKGERRKGGGEATCATGPDKEASLAGDSVRHHPHAP